MLDIRVAQVAPDHPDAHVQVLGAEQVPPFWQADEQTAKQSTEDAHKIGAVNEHTRGARCSRP